MEEVLKLLKSMQDKMTKKNRRQPSQDGHKLERNERRNQIWTSGNEVHIYYLVKRLEDHPRRDDGLPRNDGGTSGVQGTSLSGHDT
jgi:hypothetical protein